MLVQLHIKNFAIIDEVNIEFSQGLNVLSGETGAGKSIVIDAVSLLLGGRAQSEFIRAGCEKAFVEGFFDYSENKAVADRLQELGFVEEENQLILTREISLNNKNICRVNNRIVTLGVYKEIGKLLIDIHGQHDHQSLLNSQGHGDILDGFGNNDFFAQLISVKGAFSELQKLDKYLRGLRQSERDKNHRMDLLNFQVNEIEAAHLQSNEDFELEKELNLLLNGEKIIKATNNCYQILFAQQGRQMSAFDLLNQAIAELSTIQNVSQEISSIYNQLESAMYQVEEVAMELRDFGEGFEFSNERLNYCIERNQLIKDLKKKYGETIEIVTDYLASAKEELQQMVDMDKHIEKASKEFTTAKALFWQRAKNLTEMRKDIASQLEIKIAQELKALAMKNTQFQVSFNERIEEASNGIDEMEFLISPNPGEPLKPLAKIASGGEMSRIMLAMKVILSEVDGIDTLIFDEIDSGVGGRSVQMVAEKLYELGQSKQVICVTHSPHIASSAETHYQISKNYFEGRTVTSLVKLIDQLRIDEIARMLGDSEGAKQHALELLKLN